MAERELIEPNPVDRRYVRQDEDGQFGETDDVGNASAQNAPSSLDCPWP